MHIKKISRSDLQVLTNIEKNLHRRKSLLILNSIYVAWILSKIQTHLSCGNIRIRS